MALELFDLADRWLRASPWRLLGVVCVVGFLAGGLLDLDHIPYGLGIHIGSVPFEWVAAHGVPGGRLFHGLALVGGGIMCACAGGYLYTLVLRDVASKTMAGFKKKMLRHIESDYVK